MNTINQMVSDLPRDEAEQVRLVLTDIATLAQAPAPPASAEVLGLISGGVRRSIIRRRAVVAAAAGALAFGGTSVAAAQNTLPSHVQEVVADFADDHLPVSVPHPEKPDHPVKPVKPTNPPYDAPGHVKNKHKEPKPLNTTAPGQIQKLTKPDPGLPGPAKPADPGSHGRATAADAQADKPAKTDKK